jgi:Flp pilus assembly protein TadG
MKKGRLLARGSAGQGLVEFALVFPLIIMLVLGAIDLGGAVFSATTGAQAARQAARAAIVDQTISDVQAAAIAAAPTLGLSSANVDVCFKTATSTQRDCTTSTDDCSAGLVIGCLAVVVVHTQYSPITPFISSLVGPFTLLSSSIQPIENVCPTSGHPSCP